MNNGGFLGFGRGAPTSDTAISRYVQSPVYYNSTTIRPPPGTKKIHVWLVGGGGGAGSWRRQRGHSHHNDYGQHAYSEATSEAGGGGFGGAALFELPVTTEPIVLTVGAGGAGPTGVGGASTITIGGVMFAKVGGGASGAGFNDANQFSFGVGGRFGGGGSGGTRQTSSSLHNGIQHVYHANYGTGSGGGEPPNSARGGALMLSWLYPEGNTAWRDTGHNASQAQSEFPNYVNLTVEGMGDVKVPGSFVMPGPTTPLQAPYNIAHATQGHHSYSYVTGVSGTSNSYTALYPFPLGTAFKPLINRDRTRNQHHDNHHGSHQTQGSGSSVKRGAFGWFGAGGWGGSGTDPQQTENQAEPNGFGAGGGAGGGQGNHGGGGGGPNLHQDSHNPAIGFTQSPGTGGSFTSTPHLWGLRTGQTTGPGGAGLFTPVTGQNGGAGGGGAGVQSSTQGTQQHTPGAQNPGWYTAYPHETAQGGRAQGAPTGGGGAAVFRFYL